MKPAPPVGIAVGLAAFDKLDIAYVVALTVVLESKSSNGSSGITITGIKIVCSISVVIVY